MSSLSRIGPHTCSGATREVRRPGVAALGHPEHVGVGVGRHPLGGREDLLDHPLGLGEPGVRVVPGRALLLLRVRRDAGPRAVAHQHQRVAQRVGHGVDPAGLEVVDRGAQHVAGVGEVVGLAALDVALRALGRAVDVGGVELVGRRLGHPGHQLVRLVDHDDVVVRDHRDALDRVDREQRVVGDDQVRALGLLARELGEALLAERALGRPEALAVVDRDLPPLAVGVPRRVVALAGAAGLGLLLGPAAQLQHLGRHRALRAPRSACPGRRARRPGSGAGRRSWSAP